MKHSKGRFRMGTWRRNAEFYVRLIPTSLPSWHKYTVFLHHKVPLSWCMILSQAQINRTSGCGTLWYWDLKNYCSIKSIFLRILSLLQKIKKHRWHCIAKHGKTSRFALSHGDSPKPFSLLTGIVLQPGFPHLQLSITWTLDSNSHFVLPTSTFLSQHKGLNDLTVS